jgi:transcriptional regulator with XRE-family HTH domain
MSSTRGERLSAAMAARRVPKLSAMAAELGVSESAISRWRHNGSMTVDNVEAVCRILDISADWLLLARGSMDLHKYIGADPDMRLSAALKRMTTVAQEHLLSFLLAINGQE